MHKLTQIDPDGLLPKEKDSPNGKDCICEAWGYMECGCGASWTDNTPWNECFSQVTSLGVEVDVEELAKVIERYKWENGIRFLNKNEVANQNKELAIAISNNKDILKMVKGG